MSVPVIYFDLGNTLVYGPAENRQPFDDAVATIEELWKRGYRIGLLSDQYPGTTEENVRQKLLDYGLEDYRFDTITISSEFDPPIYKPDAQIFQTAIDKAGHGSASDQTVFVTENIDHIIAARDLGWRAIHSPYPGTCTAASGECIEELDDLLVLFPQLLIDIYIRDAPGDPGVDQFTGPVFWNSPDLWIRNNEDNGVTHQNPEAGQDNWFYTRVHNRGIGIARLFFVAYRVQEWAGTQFVYPADWAPHQAYAFGGLLDPGQSTIIHAKWEATDVPPAGTHACWLANAGYAIGIDWPASGAHVWEHNNLAQKNLLIVDLIPGETKELEFVIGNRNIDDKRLYSIELHRSKNALNLPISIVGQSRQAMAKLVRTGKSFESLERAAVKPHKPVGFRFLEPVQAELMGTDTNAARFAVNFTSGSTITIDSPVKRKPVPANRIIPKYANANIIEGRNGESAIVFPTKRAVSSIKISLRPRQVVRCILRISAPKDAEPGNQFNFDIVQRGKDGQIVGGISVKMTIQKRS